MLLDFVIDSEINPVKLTINLDIPEQMLYNWGLWRAVWVFKAEAVDGDGRVHCRQAAQTLCCVICGPSFRWV